MKTAVVTICIGAFYKALSEITHPMIKNYADKIGADFICLTETKFPLPHYAKFQIGKLLEKYDRVLYLDSDILVSPQTPNIFEVVPENKIGMLDESPLGYHNEFRSFLQQYGPQFLGEWERHRKCYNAGVIVCSKRHKQIFELPKVFPNHHFEQSYLNLRLLEEKTEIFSLPYQYNRMIYLDLVIPEHRLKSYIIHYAGFLEKRPIEECQKFLEKEYKMLLSQDFSEDDVVIGWAKV